MNATERAAVAAVFERLDEAVANEVRRGSFEPRTALAILEGVFPDVVREIEVTDTAFAETLCADQTKRACAAFAARAQQQRNDGRLF